MLIWSKDERQQQGKEKPCGCYDRAVFGKPFVGDGVIQEEDSLTSAIHANKEKKENTKPSVFASMRKQSRQTLSMLLPLSMFGGRSMIRKVSLGRFIVGLMLVIITVHQ